MAIGELRNGNTLPKAVCALAAGFLLNVAFGIIYTFGNISPYIISYMMVEGGEAVSYKDSIWIYSTAISSIGMMMIFGGIIQGLIGYKFCVLLFGTLFSTCVFISAWTVKSYVLFLITYGVLCGIFDGLSYSCPLGIAYAWWPDKKGIASGIVLSGTGLSALIFGPLQTINLPVDWIFECMTLIVNPDNLLPTYAPFPDKPNELYYNDPKILSRVPWIFIILGGIFGVLCLTSTVLISTPDEYYTAKWYAMSKHKIAAQIKGVSHDGEIGREHLSPKEVIFSFKFWLFWVYMVILSFMVSYLATFWKFIGQSESNMNDKAISFWGNTVISLANTLGRPLVGSLEDSVGINNIMLYLPLVISACMYSMPSVLRYYFPLYFLWLAALYVCVGGIFVLMPTFIGDAFGATHFGTNFGMMYTSRVVGALSSSLLISYLHQDFGTLGLCKLIALLILCATAIAYMFIFFDTSRKKLRPRHRD